MDSAELLAQRRADYREYLAQEQRRLQALGFKMAWHETAEGFSVEVAPPGHLLGEEAQRQGEGRGDG